MIEGPEVYYSCSDCVLSFVKAASNGVYVEATTDHARCSTGCRAKATFVCRVYPDEQESDKGDDQKGSPEVCRCALCNPGGGEYVDIGFVIKERPKYAELSEGKTGCLPDQEPAPKESCLNCRYMTVTEATLFKARKAIMRVVHSGETASQVINEFLNAGLLIRERI